MAERLPLCHFLLVFFGRHWVLGTANAALTALTGLGLVSLGSRWRALRLGSLQRLRLRRGVLLAAAVKGALLLVVGEGYPGRSRAFAVVGLQLPDPLVFTGLSPRTIHSVWYPSSITAYVGLALLGLSGLSLLFRAVQVWRAERDLDVLQGWEQASGAGTDGDGGRARRALARAARSMGLPAGAAFPPVLLVDLPCPTPLLMGLKRPRIVLSPRLAGALSDAEMELAFRHELAHFLRGDHLWRWVLVWVRDIGWITGAVGWLSARAGADEEELCDRLAVRSAPEAALLAGALTKSAAAGGVPPAALAPILPSLLGQPAVRQNDPRAIRLRLERLLRLAGDGPDSSGCRQAGPARSPARVTAARVLFGTILLLLLYTKYLFYLNFF